ncbi:hypothetical protein MKW92_040119, partial [Papaver armeniacum]
KRNVGIIQKFVFNSGAEDEPISPSGKSHLLEMLENYDNPERSDLFHDSDEDVCIGSLLPPQQKKKKRKN